MSADEDEEGVLRMVTVPYRSRPNDEMNLIGLAYAAGLVLVMLPLVPFLVLLWLLSGLRDAIVGQPDADA